MPGGKAGRGGKERGGEAILASLNNAELLSQYVKHRNRARLMRVRHRLRLAEKEGVDGLMPFHHLLAPLFHLMQPHAALPRQQRRRN